MRDTLLISHITIGLTGVILNTIQLMLIVSRKEAKLAFDLTILSLNIADLIVSICFTIVFSYIYLFWTSVITTWIPTEWKMIAIGIDFSNFSSIWHSLFLAIQRSFNVLFPRKFQIYFTKKRCIAGLIVIWILSILQTALTHIGNVGLLYPSVYLIIIAACLIAFYLMICSRVCYKREQLSSTLASSSHHQNNWTLQYSVLLTITFVACTFPYIVFHSQKLFGGLIASEFIMELAITHLVLTLNPALDSVLFFIANYRQKISCQSLRWFKKEEGTMNVTQQDGCCSIACCKRNDFIESTTGSQESRPYCIAMQPMDASPAEAVNLIEANV